MVKSKWNVLQKISIKIFNFRNDCFFFRFFLIVNEIKQLSFKKVKTAHSWAGFLFIFIYFIYFSINYFKGVRRQWPPPERLRGGTNGGGSFNITSACISLPQARHSDIHRGGPAPPGKYKIKRKLRLKSNTWQRQKLRICLNSLLIQGEKSFSLLKENSSL